MSASQVKLSTDYPGVFHTPGVNAISAAKASDLLQENHDKHDIIFNSAGFHNHLVHGILSLYALGASAAEIQGHYKNNRYYQRSLQPVDKAVLEDLYDPQKFHKYLGNDRYYHEFLVFFKAEIDKKGHEAVVNEYCLQGDERANDMLNRLHAGFLHPMIHLGFGLEFKQPAIIAEALALTAGHDSYLGRYLIEAERAGLATGEGKGMVELLDDIRADTELTTAAHWEDGNKIRDGIMLRANQAMIKYGSQWKVTLDALKAKTAEMTNAVVYYTGGAQHPPKQVKFDFYYIHCVNCTIFYHMFLNQIWMSDEHKARLLEWKGRVDLMMYASRRSPEPLIDEIINYKPKKPSSEWDDIFLRARRHNEDDGHCIKLVRALAHGEKLCAAYESRDPSFRIKGDMWLQLGHMAIDSVEDSGDTWVRSAGFPQAWERFRDRDRAQL